MKYIEIEEFSEKCRKPTYTVNTKKDSISIGLIEYYSRWKQYCFFPLDRTVFSYECLQDIAAFIIQKNKEVRP